MMIPRSWSRPFLLVLAGISLTASSCFAESITITIRFANGKTGKSLKLKSYEHGSASVGYQNYHIDKVSNDEMTVTFTNATVVGFRSEQFEPCDVANKRSKPPQYILKNVVDTGVVAPNFCGTTQAQPVPGELLIYSRHEHWWKVTSRIMQGLLICA
jgi:hypothetical protein